VPYIPWQHSACLSRSLKDARAALAAGRDHDIRVYAFPNNGGWYDFGVLLGVGSLGGGAAASR
jgi:hypothetical protein